MGREKTIKAIEGISKEIESGKIKTEEDLAKGLDEMPEEGRKNIALGLHNVGHFVEEKKNKFFANVFSDVSNQFDKKSTIGRFTSSMKEIFNEDAEKAQERMAEAEDIKTGKKKMTGFWGSTSKYFKKFSNQASLTGNILKYGRVVYDVVGPTGAFSPLRYVMMGGMAFSRGAGAAREARLKNEEVIEKTRIKDIEEAEEIAFEIYKQAEKKGATKKSLDEAYRRAIPDDLIKRLSKNPEPNVASSIIQKIVRKDVEFSVKRIDKKIKEIQSNKELPGYKKEEEIERIINKYSKHLKDLDRIVTQYGTVDSLAMGAMYLETGAKAAVYATMAETLAMGIKNIGGRVIPWILEKIADDDSVKTGLAEASVSVGIINTRFADGAGIPNATEVASASHAAEPAISTEAVLDGEKEIILEIGKKGPEGAIIKCFTENEEVAKQFGWDGEKDINKWAGVAAHKIWSEQATEALKDKEVIKKLGELGYSKDAKGYGEMMRRIHDGNINLNIDNKAINFSENTEFLKAKEAPSLKIPKGEIKSELLAKISPEKIEVPEPKTFPPREVEQVLDKRVYNTFFGANQAGDEWNYLKDRSAADVLNNNFGESVGNGIDNAEVTHRENLSEYIKEAEEVIGKPRVDEKTGATETVSEFLNRYENERAVEVSKIFAGCQKIEELKDVKPERLKDVFDKHYFIVKGLSSDGPANPNLVKVLIDPDDKAALRAMLGELPEKHKDVSAHLDDDGNLKIYFDIKDRFSDVAMTITHNGKIAVEGLSGSQNYKMTDLTESSFKGAVEQVAGEKGFERVAEEDSMKVADNKPVSEAGQKEATSVEDVVKKEPIPDEIASKGRMEGGTASSATGAKFTPEAYHAQLTYFQEHGLKEKGYQKLIEQMHIKNNSLAGSRATNILNEFKLQYSGYAKGDIGKEGFEKIVDNFDKKYPGVLDKNGLLEAKERLANTAVEDAPKESMDLADKGMAQLEENTKALEIFDNPGESYNNRIRAVLGVIEDGERAQFGKYDLMRKGDKIFFVFKENETVELTTENLNKLDKAVAQLKTKKS